MKTKSPKYLLIKNYIIDKIQSGQLEPHQQIPTELKLCEMFDVSRITASRAINELEMEGCIYRVQGKGSYVNTSYTDKSLEVLQDSFSLDTKTIAIIFSNNKLHEYGQIDCLEILYGAQKKLEIEGYNLTVFFSDEDLEKERELITAVFRGSYKGLILFPINSTENVNLIRQMMEESYPFVIIDRPVANLQTNLVISDNFDGAYQAVTHLIETGHSHILFLSIDLFYAKSVTMRYEGYSKALEDHGIPFRKEYVIDFFSKGNIKSILNAKLDPTSEEYFPISAIFAMNDEIAIETMKALTQLGIEIPEQISLIGFDDSPTLKHLNVPISTIKQSRTRMGEEAAQIMVDHFLNRNTSVRQTILSTKLVIRESTIATVKMKSS